MDEEGRELALSELGRMVYLVTMTKSAKPKIVEGPINIGKPSAPRYRTAIGPDGNQVRIRVIDPNSPTFTADLLSSFRANVKRARKESKALGLDV